MALIAAVTRVAFAAPRPRGWLGYRFPGVPARPDIAVLIFEHNLLALLGVLGVLLIAQIAARASDRPGPIQRAVHVCAEVSLAAGIAANTLVVGVAIGAYGLRMVRAVLPHGPIELAAYTLAIALYLHGRRRALPARQIAATIATSLALAGRGRCPRDVRDRMRPGRPLLALVLVAAGVGIAVPVLSNSLHKLSAQGWFHPNATKGGLIQPATPTPQTTPVTGLLQPPTPTPAPAQARHHPPQQPPRRRHGRRNSAHAHRSPSHGQPSSNPAPRPASHARPGTGIGRSQAGCCPPRPCVPSSRPAWRSPPASG